MSDAVWFFVDLSHQRHGPATAAAVAEAHAAGTIDDNSLVWRDGLGNWAPLGAHRTELGIVGPPRVQPRPAYPYPAEPAKSSKKLGCLIIGAVCAIGAVPMLAILAAIALPAYQDYIIRSQLTAGLADIRGYVTVVEEFHASNGRCPSAEEIGVPDEASHSNGRWTTISIGEDGAGNCRIDGGIVGGNPQLNGAMISLTRDEAGQWTCTSSESRPKYLPKGCSSE